MRKMHNSKTMITILIVVITMVMIIAVLTVVDSCLLISVVYAWH